MDPAQQNAMAKRPLHSFSRGGSEVFTKQRPIGDILSAGSGRFEQLPPFSIHQANPQLLPLVTSTGAPGVAAHLQPKYGSASVGQGPSRQQRPRTSHHPDVICLHSGSSAFAGQQLPSIHDVLSGCLTVINQYCKQNQHTLPTAPAPSRNAMAAAPSSSTLSQSPSQQFEVRITIQLQIGSTKANVSCDILRDSTMTARNRIDCGQGVREDGCRTFRNIRKGRKWNNSATAKRRTCDVEPLEVQVVLEPTVGKGTSIINGKKYGKPAPPAVVNASAATEQLEGESTRDVIVDSKKTRKVIHSPDGVDENDRCPNADTTLSAKMQKNSSSNNNNQHSASCTIDAVDSQFDRCKWTPAVVPVDHHVCAPPVVAAHVHISIVKKIESFLDQHRYSCPQVKCVDAKAHQLFIIHHGRWRFSGVVAFVDQPPPWPPPAQDRPAHQHVPRIIAFI